MTSNYFKSSFEMSNPPVFISNSNCGFPARYYCSCFAAAFKVKKRAISYRFLADDCIAPALTSSDSDSQFTGSTDSLIVSFERGLICLKGERRARKVNYPFP